MFKKRLVLYVGYDQKSKRMLRRVSNVRSLFDEVRVIFVPDNDPEFLSNLSIPSIIIEEIMGK